MSQVTIDADLIAKLLIDYKPIDLIDTAGTVIGQFVPKLNVADSVLSADETQKRLADGRTRYTTEQVLTHLRKLQ